MTQTMIIAEIAQAHDGSLGTAHAYIDAVANAGADVIKFQTHIADAESTPGEPWRVKFSPQDDTRYEYWKRMEFSEEQWSGLKQHADDRDLLFVSSAFSNEAVDLLSRIGVYAWKIASGETNNLPLLSQMAAHKRPFWISTGMSTWSEIDKAVQVTKDLGIPVSVLQCTSKYPTAAQDIGLNVISQFKERYTYCGVGLSDHSGTIFAGLAAAALNIDLLEVHVTLSREAFGPDVTSSITLDELKQLVQGVRYVDMLHDNPVDKNQMAVDLQQMRDLFNKSIVTSQDLVAGTVLTDAHLSVKKPGTGIPAAEFENIIGRKLKVDVKKDALLQLDYLV